MNDKISFEDILESDGVLVYKTKGVSMKPMLRQNRDVIVITKKDPAQKLQPMDVALYKRGEQYVLHRVIRATESGYEIRGDNTFAIEKVPETAVIGVLQSFTRNGKNIDVNDRGYQRYARLWNNLYPVRKAYSGCKRTLRKFKRKILKK